VSLFRVTYDVANYMIKYRVNFESNQERVIDYIDLNVSTYQGFASQTMSCAPSLH
jgi:hypothetical protein